MKKQTTNVIEKKAITLLLALVIVFSSSVNLYASPDRTGTDQLEGITYKGLKDKSLVFKVKYDNELAKSFELIIKNEYNDILYSKNYGAKPINTDVLLSEFPENCKLTFLIRTGKKDLTKSFVINTEVKTSQEYIVKGL